ncbi:MAG TPA: UDP-forming cellulose synthase catalytic subunit [Chroococcidiopsis sp.]
MTTLPDVQPGRPRRQSFVGRFLLGIPEWCDRIFPQEVGKWPLFSLVVLLLVLSAPLVVTPLKIWQQTIVAVFLMALGWFVVELEQKQTRRRSSEYLHLFLAWLSVVTTLRYLYYRTNYTLNFDGWVNGFFCLLLYAAEFYAIATLLLSYFQTLKLLDRKPVDISGIPQSQWFSVDIYIPTYNEDVGIVRKTAVAALAIDYPDDKKRVYILDDGRAEKYRARREKLRQMCEELGCTLLTRDNNEHAKAGNINTAMRRTKGDLILILDCDHIPSRQFLQHTVGFFYNPKVALVQTPHWFYNPDPFERNLLTQGRVPVGNELFYKVLQKGNDFWNAAFFCGSAAVIRKDYVLQIGGIATETVTEDCHTSLRLHSLGYESVYYDKIMVAGLAPETFSAYVGQQVRWARGMAQILRIENPLLNRKLKLSLPQRLCYFSATSHFFFGFPRLMYALAPVLYLLFGINLIQGIGVETLVYALPHILLAMNANYITYKAVRFSFWNEIFEYAMAFQDGMVTLMALVNPKLGSFNVTDKGVSVNKRIFDWESARASVVMTALLVISLLAVPFWLILQPEAKEAALINALWSIFNLLLIGTALLVAFEQPQMRRAHRLDRKLTTIIYGSNQMTWTGQTIDVSENGARILLEGWPNLPDAIELELVGDFGARAFLNAKVVRVESISESQTRVAVDFTHMTQAQMDALVLVLYSDVRQWYSQERTEIDRPFESLRFIVAGLLRALREPKPAKAAAIRKQIQAVVQVYWEGHFYSGTAIEMSSKMLRVEMDMRAMPNLEIMRRTNPLVGLVVSQSLDDPAPKRLIAELQATHALNPQSVSSQPFAQSSAQSVLQGDRSAETMIVEFAFPQHLDQRQGAKIKQLLKTLE